ncbi:hypothetical protein [Microcoleus sp. herbarium12]|uniref:hypothetical protein n=1 Tax=Microcoleus sp. herbarium12 TaxID=3055437 RepID=UPI002FCFB9D3
MVKNSNNLQKGSIWGYLTLLLPICLTAVASFESGTMFWAIATTAGIAWAYKLYQQQQKHKQASLDLVFYRLIKENQGRVTALDLAMNAKLPGSKVQEYLDERALEFAADFQVTEEGGILYYFQIAPTVTPSETPKVAVAVQEPPTNREKTQDKTPKLFPIDQPKTGENPKISFTQTELSRRFKVHATTIGKWKVKPEFAQWSREKDPENLAWEYSTDNKRFYPKD